MLLGVDVGGTHTDAVVLDKGQIISSTKVLTDTSDLLSSINEALKTVLSDISPSKIQRMNLSTTLSTNALTEGNIEETAVIVSAGPGIDPEGFRMGNNYFPVAGAIDHCGREMALLDKSEIQSIASLCSQANLNCAAVVSKFSPYNPAHEKNIAQILAPNMNHISLGHRMSGHLNFPRRIATAYYNASVWSLFNKFADAVELSASQYGITAPINILKADGGTMPINLAREMPVESILSGPAASVMGIMALSKIEGNALILDIGGTTTDIAMFAEGSPVIEEKGAIFAGTPTSVRAIKALSIGIGGDSNIIPLPLQKIKNISNKYQSTSKPLNKKNSQNQTEEKTIVQVGPERLGPCMALGGKTPTLIDAFNTSGLCNFGDIKSSQKGIKELAVKNNLTVSMLTKQIINQAINSIKWSIEKFIQEINNKPVYTIRELLGRRSIEPNQIFLMGGPAGQFKKLLEKTLQKRIILPPHYSIANAIGAAMARNTFELELFADTQQRKMLIPILGIERKVPKEYSLEAAKKDAMVAMINHLRLHGIREKNVAIDVTEANSFNMVGDAGLAGRNIRVKCQIRPGLYDN